MPAANWQDYKKLMRAGDQQVIVQLVGPDMTGKTEIAKGLAERLDIPYFKASSEHQTYLKNKDLFIKQLRYADPRMVDFLRQTGYDVVFDRGYPCEYVYSHVMKRETDISVIWDLDQRYAALGTKIIFCHRTDYEGITDDLDGNIDSDVLLRLDWRYRHFFEGSQCDVHYLNVDDEDLNREIDDVILWLQKTALTIPQTKAQQQKTYDDALDVVRKRAATRRLRPRCYGCCQENCGYICCRCKCHD